ncbi:hypothetical protein I5M27_17615 [Adhaeribacter sp. BT258]|uniref:Uncharacterized protein n=1 Tax=Adhaeribacter terrigena TaxID=2793070 RepID=A0ABS1C619_9BACT|nr:hypothetical protein [Adhaeribacter terrigena]MBK0404814.1 hypothetical protein [Adhaeribacter terrigena]
MSTKAPEIYKFEPSRKLVKPVIASTKSARINAMVKHQKTKVQNQYNAVPATDTTGKLRIQTQTSEETPVLIAAENPKVTAKKRNHYVELDFDAPETLQRLPQPVQTAQLQFKIRLMPQISEPGRTTGQPENPIRLQHTF